MPDCWKSTRGVHDLNTRQSGQTDQHCAHAFEVRNKAILSLAFHFAITLSSTRKGNTRRVVLVAWFAYQIIPQLGFQASPQMPRTSDTPGQRSSNLDEHIAAENLLQPSNSCVGLRRTSCGRVGGKARISHQRDCRIRGTGISHHRRA